MFSMVRDTNKRKSYCVDQKQALQIVDAALAKIPGLRSAHASSPVHVAFVQTTGLQLARVFGRDSVISKNFSSIRYHATGGFIANVLNYEDELKRQSRSAYQHGLGIAEGILRSARELLLEPDVDAIVRGSRVRSEGARIFISHGKESSALTKVERFIRALGLQPVIVARGPSEGMSVDDLVNLRMTESDGAIILATSDDRVGDHFQPRQNVIHEIGLAQEKFDTRVIYLKEEGCAFPSNIQPRVWENFTQDNLENAFEKISKELRALGLL